MDPILYRWRPCTRYEPPRQPLLPSSRSQESSLTTHSSISPPSLTYSHSSGSSNSMSSTPPTPPPIEPYQFKAQAYVRRFEERHRPSVYEPQARKPGHRVFVLARDRDKRSNILNKPLVRCPPTDKIYNHVYYAQRTGSVPTQESLPSRPNVILSSWNTNPKLSFEPHRLPKVSKSTSRDRARIYFSPDPTNDPRDPIVEQTNQRTLQRLRPNIRPSPGLSSPPSWTTKPIISPLAMALDRLERL